MNFDLHNVLVDYMIETNAQCSFKLRNVEHGQYVIELYSNKPGILVGKAGVTIDKYTRLLKKKDKYFKGFEVNEIDGFISPSTSKISKDDWMKAVDDYYMSLGM